MIRRLSLLPAAIVALSIAGAEARVCDYNEGDLYTGCTTTINVPYCDSYIGGEPGCDSYSYYTVTGPDKEDWTFQTDNTLTISEYLQTNRRFVPAPSFDLREGTGFTDRLDFTKWGVWASDGMDLTVIVTFDSGGHRIWEEGRDPHDDGWSIVTTTKPATSAPRLHEDFAFTWSGDIYARHLWTDNVTFGYEGAITLTLVPGEDEALAMDIVSTFQWKPWLEEAYSIAGIPVTADGFNSNGVTGHFYGDNHEIAAGVIEADRGVGVFATTRDAGERDFTD